jgi:hypothetical protein
MQEGEVGVVALCTSGIIGPFCTGLRIDIDPSLRPELFSVFPPESLVPVDGPRREYHLHTGRYDFSHDESRAHGGPVDDVDGGIQPQRFIADAVGKRETLQDGREVVAVHWLTRRRDKLVYLRAKSSLHFGVLGEQVCHPCERHGRGTVSGGENCEELVNKLLMSESGRSDEVR